MKTSEILIRARDLIADPARWTQKSSARDAQGSRVNAFANTATCWCSDGALVKATDWPTGYEAYGRSSRVLRETVAGMGLDSYVDFNDTHTHAEVMTLFDTAIATAQARGD